jgi:hypothetical protein
MSYGTFSFENRDFLGFRMIFKVWLNQFFQTLTQCCGPLNTGEVQFRSYFTFNVPQLWPFFFLENRDFLGFGRYLKYGSIKSFQTLTQCCGPVNTD